MCHLYGKFASYLRRVLCKTRLIFPRINGPNIYVRFGNSVFGKEVVGIPMGIIHTSEYDFMLTTMKQDVTKAVSFGYTFRHTDDIFNVNNEGFGDYISAIYLSELELKETTMASNEVCYLATRIRHKDGGTTYHISVYDKRGDFNFQIVNFSHMDSNIPATPTYGVQISQLVRFARIHT